MNVPGPWTSWVRGLVPLLWGVIMTGCASLQQPAEQGSLIVSNWQQHTDRVRQLNHWEIKGKIGIRTATDGGSGFLEWRQWNDQYKLRLSGPLGQGTTHIVGSADAATLTSNQGEFSSSSPEALVYEHTGWDIPIQNLLYWVKGIPADHGSYRSQRNESGTLARLEQLGWTLSFSRYTLALNHPLPQKIKIEKDDLTVTLIIKQWQNLNRKAWRQ